MKLLHETQNEDTEDLQEYGLSIRYFEIGIIQLWLIWILASLWGSVSPWNRTKQLARRGELIMARWCGPCLYPLWTNVYCLRGWYHLTRPE